jgi:hypothetical protein
VLNGILIFSFSVPLGFIIMNLKTLFYIDSALQIILLSILMSLIAFAITYRMIPVFRELHKIKKIFGVDINKCADVKDLKDPNRIEV